VLLQERVPSDNCYSLPVYNVCIPGNVSQAFVPVRASKCPPVLQTFLVRHARVFGKSILKNWSTVLVKG
jgi:hypothetical protein